MSIDMVNNKIVNILQRIASHKLMLALPILAAAVIYLWTPISELYFMGTLHENVIVQLESEVIKVDEKRQLLVLHIKPVNKGSVPVAIIGDGKKGKITIEVKQIDKTQNEQWVESDQLRLVNKIDILRHHAEGYTIEPNSYYDEVEAITLPLGTYWIKAIVTFDDGDYVDQSLVVKLSNE